MYGLRQQFSTLYLEMRIFVLKTLAMRLEAWLRRERNDGEALSRNFILFTGWLVEVGNDGNVSRCYRRCLPRVKTPNEERDLAVTAKRNRQSTASDLSRQLSLDTGTTVSRQTVYRCFGHIGLYARRPVHLPQLTVACD
ncbi:HTH_Tnp_Tc3_2 domain-containing protein [Trichonephila clavipes]|nr:HTH_Tnp_Tc3_2 domain-containing protein [Trichonephila clavipes]